MHRNLNVIIDDFKPTNSGVLLLSVRADGWHSPGVVGGGRRRIPAVGDAASRVVGVWIQTIEPLELGLAQIAALDGRGRGTGGGTHQIGHAGRAGGQRGWRVEVHQVRRVGHMGVGMGVVVAQGHVPRVSLTPRSAVIDGAAAGAVAVISWIIRMTIIIGIIAAADEYRRTTKIWVTIRGEEAARARAAGGGVVALDLNPRSVHR